MKKAIIAVLAALLLVGAVACNGDVNDSLLNSGNGGTGATKNYLTFKAEEAPSTVIPKFKNGSYQYSLDNGATWIDGTIDGTTTITLTNIGDTVMLKGSNCTTGYDEGYNVVSFTMTGKIAASGDVTSLTNGEGGDATLQKSCYVNMFRNCTVLTTAPELPATTLTNNCYSYMFSGCTSLITAPELPATTLTSNCYNSMFSGCTSLTSAPALPATTLANYCYDEMFSGCTSLTTAPELPAGKDGKGALAEHCYDYMFGNCKGLEAAPELPAKNLADSCYLGMFFGCTKLTTAPALPATELAVSCYNTMFFNCTGIKVEEVIDATNATWNFTNITEATYWSNNMINGVASGSVNGVTKGHMYKVTAATSN